MEYKKNYLTGMCSQNKYFSEKNNMHSDKQ